MDDLNLSEYLKTLESEIFEQRKIIQEIKSNLDNFKEIKRRLIMVNYDLSQLNIERKESATLMFFHKLLVIHNDFLKIAMKIMKANVNISYEELIKQSTSTDVIIIKFRQIVNLINKNSDSIAIVLYKAQSEMTSEVKKQLENKMRMLNEVSSRREKPIYNESEENLHKMYDFMLNMYEERKKSLRRNLSKLTQFQDNLEIIMNNTKLTPEKKQHKLNIYKAEILNLLERVKSSRENLISIEKQIAKVKRSLGE